MAAVEMLEKEITKYLRRLSIQQKEAVLGVVKTFAGEEYWTEKGYENDMNHRFAELESGTIKGYTLEELESGARQSYQNKKLNEK